MYVFHMILIGYLFSHNYKLVIQILIPVYFMSFSGNNWSLLADDFYQPTLEHIVMHFDFK